MLSPATGDSAMPRMGLLVGTSVVAAAVNAPLAPGALVTTDGVPAAGVVPFAGAVVPGAVVPGVALPGADAPGAAGSLDGFAGDGVLDASFLSCVSSIWMRFSIMSSFLSNCSFAVSAGGFAAVSSSASAAVLTVSSAAA